MHCRNRAIILSAFLLLPCLATVRAQEAPWQLAVTGARVDYDLSGVGNAPGLAVRLTLDIASNVSVELGGLFVKPDQQFGSSTLFIPEALVRYGWRFGRIAPYVGGGLGAALVKSSFHSDWDPTMAVAAGTSVRVTDRFSIVGEFRLRGHEWRATGTTTEVAAGISWRFGAR